MVTVLLLLGGLPAIAHALDGSINQLCATWTGCFGGDTKGFPVTISRPGNYQLNSNLTVPNENTTAILITANDVTLDLNGFTISGSTVCSGSPMNCSPAGTGTGIDASSASNTSIVNGTVRGMGFYGIEVGSNSRVENVKAISNGANGISTGTGSLIRGSIASENGGNGISTSEYSTVKDNIAHRNGGNGINTGCVCTVIGNSATSNGGSGISTGGTSGCVNNLACENTVDQITGCTQMGGNICCYGLCQ